MRQFCVKSLVVFGLGLPALGGGFEEPKGLGSLFRGHAAHGLTVQVIAPIPPAVDQGQQVPVPAGVVGQRPAQQDRIEVGHAFDHIGEDADL